MPAYITVKVKMKKRIIWKMFLLEIVTLGIYRLFFFMRTRKEMMAVDPSIKILSPIFLFLPLIFIVICLAAIVGVGVYSASSDSSNLGCTSSYSSDVSNSLTLNSSSSSAVDTTGNQSSSNCSHVSGAFSIVIIISYLAIFLSAIPFIIWEWSYSHAVDKITGGRISFALSLIILILVPDGIDILIIQDYFNKVGDHPMPPHHPYAPQPQYPAQPQYAPPQHMQPPHAPQSPSSPVQ
jgi:hypothetical protein